MQLFLQLPATLAMLVAAHLASASTTLTTATATTTSGASSSSATSLASLVAELPTCALQCFSSAAADVHCSPTNFTCLCSSSSSLVENLGPCILLSSCSSQDVSKATALAPQICSAVDNNPSPSDVAAASSEVASALGTAGATSSSTSTANAAMKTEVAMGLVGAMAGLAALAL